MKSNPRKEWNREVQSNVDSLKSAKNWLKRMITHQDNDWESQKSAHHALKFLEMAEYEMWNMQWWYDHKQKMLHRKAEETVV